MKGSELVGFGYPEGVPERENLGVFVDIYYFRMKALHALVQDPSLVTSSYGHAKELFEEEVSGRMVDLGLDEFFGKEFWGMNEVEMESVVESLVSGNEEVLMRELGLGVPLRTEFYPEERALRVRVAESLESSNFPRLGRAMCFFLSGMLAGITSGRMGDHVAFEEKCLARGDGYCEFFVGPRTPYVGRMRNYLDIPPDRSSAPPGAELMLTGSGGSVDFSVLRESFVNDTLRALRYLGGEARPELGKQFHLFVLQQQNLGMVGSSPEAPSLLREAGRDAGLSLARVGVASDIPRKEMVALLPELLMRTGMGMVELFRTEGGYEVRVSECAESVGLEREEPLCHFEGGLFAGFFQHLESVPVESEEARCIAEGADLCVHRLEREGEGALDLEDILGEVEEP